MIATEATIFLGLISAYFFVRASSKEWPQGGIHPPELGRISVFTVILLASSLPIFWGEAAIKRSRKRQLQVALLISLTIWLSLPFATPFATWFALSLVICTAARAVSPSAAHAS